MNMEFGKLNLTGGVEYAPNPAVIVTHHHDEWEEPVEGEEGVTEHKTSDWDERKKVYSPTAEQYLRAEGGPYYPVANNQPEYREGFTPVRKGYEEREGKIVTVWEYEPIRRTEQDFNAALEQHLSDERTARGYDEREPSDYKDSGIARWRQDALDWIAHRDDVMMYGLAILNEWKKTKVEPDYAAFVAGLPKIVWTIQDEPKTEEA